LEALFSWLEASSLGQLVRSSGVWAYGILNLTHILSVATLFGSVLALDLRLMGFWRDVPIAAIERPTLPLAAFGFVGAVLSGVSMLSTNGSEYVGNPFVPIKFAAIGLALANAAVLLRLSAWRSRHDAASQPRTRRTLAAAGAISLACWLTAAGAGRMIGYW